MVDFGGLKNKVEGFIADNDEKIKSGIEKAGDFVGGKIGHEKVDGVEDKLTGLVDKLAGNDQEPTVPPAATPPVTPPAATPPVTPPAATTPPVTPPAPTTPTTPAS
ncbi:antitoxin [Nakamurella sp. A5-74]|uniref:Antitoxin n=1 Tax=Nakamurella sp. A5-74 TaxID=3158264 RepID=A0AAU8DUD2_9ACTN